jgi:hypothetical protein
VAELEKRGVNRIVKLIQLNINSAIPRYLFPGKDYTTPFLKSMLLKKNMSQFKEKVYRNLKEKYVSTLRKIMSQNSIFCVIKCDKMFDIIFPKVEAYFFLRKGVYDISYKNRRSPMICKKSDRQQINKHPKIDRFSGTILTLIYLYIQKPENIQHNRCYKWFLRFSIKCKYLT